jgi:hypothetical protein
MLAPEALVGKHCDCGVFGCLCGISLAFEGLFDVEDTGEGVDMGQGRRR